MQKSCKILNDLICLLNLDASIRTHTHRHTYNMKCVRINFSDSVLLQFSKAKSVWTSLESCNSRFEREEKKQIHYNQMFFFAHFGPSYV